MQKQDFSKKISIVADKALPSWQVLNTVAHISAYFGNQIDNFDTGESFSFKGGVIPRNSQYPIIVLEADKESLQRFARHLLQDRPDSVKQMFFVKEMIETSKDAEIEANLPNKNLDQIEFLGVGLFGENGKVKRLTQAFQLWQQ